MDNILDCKNAKEFRLWLEKNGKSQKECFLKLKRGRPQNDDKFYYIDAVETALCFGWIDSTNSSVAGVRLQRFSPRTQNSLWTELNKERVRRLEKLGLMTDSGRAVLPDMKIRKVILPDDVKQALVDARALKNFNAFPELYKRIRIYNLKFMKKKLPNDYPKTLENFVRNTKENKLYGDWNDYGRLIDY